MSVTGTDLFGASFTQLAGVIRAGEGSLLFTNNDDETSELAALEIQFAYSQQLQLEPLMDGKVLGIISPARGQLTIGTLLGTDLSEFISYYSNICNWNGNQLVFRTVGDLSCDEPTLEEQINAYQAATVTCHSVLLTNLGISTQVRGVLVRSNVQMVVLNAEWTLA